MQLCCPVDSGFTVENGKRIQTRPVKSVLNHCLELWRSRKVKHVSAEMVGLLTSRSVARQAISERVVTRSDDPLLEVRSQSH